MEKKGNQARAASQRMIAWHGGKRKKEKEKKRLVWLCQQTPVETFVKIQKSIRLP
jgi:hypothetical protein